GTIGRVEIPPLSRHWEAAYAGSHVLLARGWERQLDIAYNPIFYTAPLTASTYHRWLRDNGVAYVAVPDAHPDCSSVAEIALVERGLPYLHQVWHSAHWRVWRVDGFDGLVAGPARLTTMSDDHLDLDVAHAAPIIVRVRASGQWSVSNGGCAAATRNGWLE